MDFIDWIPSVTTTSILVYALWLSRKLIETRLTKSVEHEFDTKLEIIRSDFREKAEMLKANLRSKESEINALRSGILTAMASRQMALDKRRLEAVDQLWTAVTDLAPAKNIAKLMAGVKFDASVKETARNPKFREVFEIMSSGFDPNKMDLCSSEKARPFVTPMAWAVFSAYQAIALQAVIKLHILKSGIGTADIVEIDVVTKLVKAALPDQAGNIDKFGDSLYHHLLDELERRLLDEMRKMLTGDETDKASVGKAAEILRLSGDLIDSARERTTQPVNSAAPKN